MIGCVICARKSVKIFGLYSKLSLLVVQCCHINPSLKSKMAITPIKGRIHVFLAVIIGFHFIYAMHNLIDNFILLDDISLSRVGRELLLSFFTISILLATLFRPKNQKKMLENTQAVIDSGLDEFNLIIFTKEDEQGVNQLLVFFANFIKINTIWMVLYSLGLLFLGMITIDIVFVFLEVIIACTFLCTALMDHLHIICVYNAIVKNLNGIMANLVKTANKTKKMRAVHRLYLSSFTQWDLLHQIYDPMVNFSIFVGIIIDICEIRLFIYNIFESYKFPFDQMHNVLLLNTLGAAFIFQTLKCDTIINYVSLTCI